MRYKPTMCNWNQISQLPRNKPSLPKTTLATSKKSRRNKIFSSILWMSRAKDWRNRKISSLLRLSPRRRRPKKPRRFSMRLRHRWTRWSAARKVCCSDGKNPSWWCKREIPLSKPPAKDAIARNKLTPFSSTNSLASEVKSAKKKNSPKN